MSMTKIQEELLGALIGLARSVDGLSLIHI